MKYREAMEFDAKMVLINKHGLTIATELQDDMFDKLVVWKMNDPKLQDRNNRIRSIPMQRQWTIEARADFADKDKNDAISEAVRRAAVHIHATLALLSDKVQPQVVAYSDDFFHGHEEIALVPDQLGKAIADHGADHADESISDEMAQAARDMQHEKNNS